MRQCLVACVYTVAFLAGMAHGENERILNATIENDTGKYSVTVTRSDAYTFLDISRIEASGEARPVCHYKTFVTFLYARPSYPEADRLITLWATGTSEQIVIFRLAPPSSGPETVLDRVSEGEPDILHADPGDLVVIYSGKYFVPNSDSWIPRMASLYLWDGHSYNLVKTVPYQERYTAVLDLDKRHTGRAQKSQKGRNQ